MNVRESQIGGGEIARKMLAMDDRCHHHRKRCGKSSLLSTFSNTQSD